MPIELDAAEARALGSLVEKSLTTRENYPLSFNSLLAACNQKSSRDPVMELDADALGRAVQSLINKGLAYRDQAPGERVPKFRHDIGRLLGTDDPKVIAVATLLLLRGPQTAGELKGRSDRLCEFAGTAEAEGLMQELCARPEPFVARQPRQPGQKEGRYCHLFFGAQAAAPAGQPAAPQPAAPAAPGQPDRVAELEKRVAALEELVKGLDARLPKTGQ